MQVSFDALPHSGKQSPRELEDFWDKSKRLQKGTLVSLWRDVIGPDGVSKPAICFATVVDREPKQLAPRAGHRPSIGIR